MGEGVVEMSWGRDGEEGEGGMRVGVRRNIFDLIFWYED